MWGYICSDDWDYQDSVVACRQLDYHNNSNCKLIYSYHFIIVFNNSGHAYSQYSFFGGSQETVPLVWDRFDCGGNETSITQCSNYSYGYNSTCTETAGIYCSSKPTNYNYQYLLTYIYRYRQLH